ncbi:MAG TPA: SDR family NAD(P)-dependent oxidoreductase [Polyangiaceae bacterium]|nr:SDR family NAD(P)-dependent oxidoreductase [Polyangiaceae bacterium]
MTGDLVILTGTSSGIGLAAALECAASGFRVVATMRNLDRRAPLLDAATARGVKIDVEQLDVTSDSAPARVRELILKYGPPYGLVNNAGIAVGGPFEEQSDRDTRDQFETNVFGLMAMTRAVLPAMRAASRGRIVNISSLSGRVGFPLVSVYAATKHAVEGLSEALRWEVEPFGIDVCLIEPGTHKTPIFFENQRRGELLDKSGPYAAFCDRIEALMIRSAERANPPDSVGRAIARVLREPSPPFRTLVGADAMALTTLRRALPDWLFATGLRRLVQTSRLR